MSYEVHDLIIEVTRKCQFNCMHCLRGCSEDVDIDLSYIDTLLREIECIGALTFTGGEPSLNVKAIEYTLQKCKTLNIPVQNFYIATNGADISEDFIMVCLKWYAYCDNKEYCFVHVSNDGYHSEQGSYDLTLLEGLVFFDKKYERENDYFENLIDDGNANENGIASHRHGRIVEFQDLELDNDYDDGFVESIYLNAIGHILGDCDYSYQTQLEYKLCDVNNLTDYIDSLIDKHEEENDD